ncbi:hypothetical protein ACFX13_009564 [Malus domestica]
MMCSSSSSLSVLVFEALVPGFTESFRDSLASNQMGYIIVVSAPVILFIMIVALAFYLLGRATGRRQSSTAPQYFGPPVPPPQEKFPEV